MRKVLITACFLVAAAAPALAYDDAFLGEVHAFAATYCPRDWAPADGSLHPIKDNHPLFALLGFEYGGDEKSGTFALPDLRSKAPAHLDAKDKGHRFKLLWCIKVKGGPWPSQH